MHKHSTGLGLHGCISNAASTVLIGPWDIRSMAVHLLLSLLTLAAGVETNNHEVYKPVLSP